MPDTVFEFWQWFDGQRGERSYRQIELAAGLSNGAISGRRNAGLTPTADMCITLADFLKVPTVEVIDRAGYRIVPAPPTQTDNPQLAAAWGLLQQLDDTTLAVVVKMLKGLTSSS